MSDARTGDEDDDPDMEELAVGNSRVLRLPPVVGTPGAAVEVHPGLPFQQRLLAAASHRLTSLSLAMAMLKQHACASFFRIDQLDSEISEYIEPRDSEGFWSCVAESWMKSGDLTCSVTARLTLIE